MSTANVFLAGTTAASVIRGIFEPGSRGIQSAWSKEVGLVVTEDNGLVSVNGLRTPSLSEASSSIRTIRDVLQGCPLPRDLLGNQPEILFDSRSARPRKDEVAPQLWSGDVPPGAFLPLGGGINITSPAFLFMQRARSLGLYQAMSYGNELCGCYSTDETERGSNDHPPFVRKGDLARMVAQCGGSKGAKIARTALKWIADGFRSPKESDTYLLTCLPRQYGGYGIYKRPEVNGMVEVPRRLRYLTNVAEYQVDLLWRDELTAVEYDGINHNNAEQRLRDDTKTNVLQEMGFKVIRINWKVLRGPLLFDGRIRMLSERLGQSIPPANWEFARRRGELRDALFNPPLR